MTDGPAADRYDRAWLLATIAFFVALSFVKAPRVLIEPRFWAEDGAFYFASFRSLDLWSALTYVANGNYQLLTNVLVYLATRVPLADAPAVTTYGAYLVEALVVVLIHAVVASYRINRLVGMLLVAAWTLMPASYETWASATNVQWLCQVSMLLVLLLPQQAIERNFAKALVWTAICGLTGVTSCMLAPGYLARAWLERSRRFAVLGALLVGCALIQLAILKTHGVTSRSFTTEVRLLTLPTLLQTVFAPLFGVDLTGALSVPLRDGAWAWSAFAYLAGLSLMLLAAGLALRAQRAAIVLMIASLWILVSILNTFGAIGDPLAHVSALGGARYFLFGAMCFCLLLALGTTAPAHAGRMTAAALLGVIVVTSGAGRASRTWTVFHTEGPSWKEELAKCAPASRCSVAIWPRGWTMQLRDQSAR